jgi:hypothetical protein
MNTPEEAGAALAHDMIALVALHFQLNDERMMAMNGMMGAFDYIEEHLHVDMYADDPQTGIAIHNGFCKVYYPYMRERYKNAVQLDDDAKKRLLDANEEMLQVYFPEGIVL